MLAIVSVGLTSAFTLLLWPHGRFALLGVAAVFALLLGDRLRRDRRRLRLSERRLAAIIDCAPDGIMTVTQDHRIVSFNAAAERIFGRPAAQALGMPLERLIDGPARSSAPADASAPRADGAAAVLSGGLRTTHALRADGSQIPIEVSVAQIEQRDERLQTVMIRDIRRRKAHEAEIERLNRLYSALAQVNQAIVRTAAPEPLFRDVCRILVEQGGFRMAWIGAPEPQADTLVPLARWGDDNEYLDRVRIYTDRRPEGSGPTGVAFREGRAYICNDLFNDPATVPWRREAERRGFRASAALPIRHQGGVFGTLSVYAVETGFFQDREVALLMDVAASVSFALENFARAEERRQAEQAVKRFAAIVESTSDAILSTTIDGVITSWNAAAHCLFGYSAGEIIGQHIGVLVPADRMSEPMAALARIGKGEHVRHFETARAHKDGRSLPVSITISPIYGAGEADSCPLAIVGASAIMRDISERKKTEAELQEYATRLQVTSRRLLEVQENERRTLARELHDTVGQELTALSLNLVMIADALPAGAAPAVRSRLDDCRTLLEDTTAHLRDVMVELRPPGIDELGLLAALQEHARRVASRTGLTLNVTGVEPRQRFPTPVAIALFRIVQEALNNTVKHAGAGAVLIELREQADLLRLSLADDGRGFEPARPAPRASCGMGMTTMRERAEAIGARLGIESDIGHGTRITVELPRTAGSPAEPQI